MVLASHPDVLEVARALAPRGRSACCLKRWQRQPSEHADDCDHGEQLDDGERAAAMTTASGRHGNVHGRAVGVGHASGFGHGDVSVG